MQIKINRRLLGGMLLLLLVVGCATISSPQGGPKDSIPPHVVLYKPAPYTTNFTGKRIEFEFNEFIALKDQSKLFFVSPEMEKKPLLTLRGKSLLVDFEDTLRADQTYRLDLGASVTDNNEGNRMDNFTYTFSTGDHIDSIVMVGQALDARTQDTLVGVFIAYFNPEKDSTYATLGLDSTLLKSRADVLFRSDSSGYFVGNILKPQPYRLYAYLDRNGNQRYEQEADLVAITPALTDPLMQNGFSFGYDSVAQRMYIDSLQVVLQLFEENKVKRQLLLEHSRPSRQELLFAYNEVGGEYDSLLLDSIPSEWIIEDFDEDRDTLRLWIAPPSKELVDSLRDTIRVNAVFNNQDSVMQYYWKREELTFTHKIQDTRTQEEIKEAERNEKMNERAEEREDKRAKRDKEKRNKKHKGMKQDSVALDSVAIDSVAIDSVAIDSVALDSVAMDTTAVDSTAQEAVENPFKMKFSASGEMNPESRLSITFELPLRKIDTSKITVTQISTIEERGSRNKDKDEAEVVREVLDAHFTMDGLRRLYIDANWKEKTKYEISVDKGIFEDIAFNSNDSTGLTITTFDPEKFGSLIFQLKDEGVDSTKSDTIAKSYIFELYTPGKKTTRGDSKNDKVDHKEVRVVKNVRDNSTVTMRFLKAGQYALRIVEDSNGDGEWTTGDMQKRQDAERVRVYRRQRDARPHIFEVKELWDVAEDINIENLFEQ